MTDDPPQHQIVEVFGEQADVRPYDKPVYRRTIQTRAVTFTCQQCGQTVTQQRYPGPTPRYCTAWCQRLATRASTRERVRRLRKRQQEHHETEER
ncbi:MAG TPA: hypothetical protein VJY65_00510 [Chloroflexota bacterium]|nr:hypothetical protein [Chloroflexota bacterium]